MRFVRFSLLLPLLAQPFPAGADSALSVPGIGTYAPSAFRITTGQCSDCPAPRQGLWYFQQDSIAVPQAGQPLSGFDKRLTLDAEAKAALASNPSGLPSLILLGAPELLPDARFASNYRVSSDSSSGQWQLVPRLKSNRSWYDRHSAAFFGTQPLKLRGEWKNQQQVFEVRSIWPRSFGISPSLPLQPLRADENLQSLVQADQGGARLPFTSRLLWRKPGSTAVLDGKAAIGIMLNGAQGDDDEAHGGHIAMATGRMGPQGDFSDLLISNFYSLDIYSEKGIVAAVTPLDNYLGDLNSGQQWYRPSYMLLAVLNNDRPANVTQDALNRVMNRFYRHDVVYNHSKLNCTGLSIDTLRSLGWHIPLAGNSGEFVSRIGFALSAIAGGSIDSGRGTFDYLQAELSRLLPAVGFREAGGDLLNLAQQRTGRQLGAYEQQLANSLEAVYFIRIPQFPSSRKWGQAPVFSNFEYVKRTPLKESERQIIPVDKRPFPTSLRD